MPFRALAAAPSCSFGIRLFDYDVYLIKIVYFILLMVYMNVTILPYCFLCFSFDTLMLQKISIIKSEFDRITYV